MRTNHEASRNPRLLWYGLQLLLILAFLAGGSSQISGWDDAAVQLLAVPVLVYALWRIAYLPPSAMRQIALGVAGLIAAVPLLQLLPLSKSLWMGPEARQSLAADLAAVGATSDFRWSLDPAATEQAFLFLLPPLAAFAATLVVGKETHRRLLRTIMLLALFSLLLAFVQLGVPAESVLNPFPQWAYQFNGVFANQNHQGISLVVGMIIALAGMISSLPHAREGLRKAWAPWVLGFVALFMLFALPLTQSRVSVLIGTFAVAAVPLMMGMFDRRHLAAGWGARVGLLTCVGVIALGAWATVGWMQVDTVDELRRPLREATSALGGAHAPLGAGVGTFVSAFEQGGPNELLIQRYVNHAHNEYLQWRMEAAWLGIAAILGAIAMLGWAAVRACRESTGDRAMPVAASLAIVALLAHSWVDYPLRTCSLATVAAALAGILVARAAGQGRHPARSAFPPVGDPSRRRHTG